MESKPQEEELKGGNQGPTAGSELQGTPVNPDELSEEVKQALLDIGINPKDP